MRNEPTNRSGPAAGATDAPSLPTTVDRATFQAELDRLRLLPKAHTREGDAIAAARRTTATQPRGGARGSGPRSPVTAPSRE